MYSFMISLVLCFSLAMLPYTAGSTELDNRDPVTNCEDVVEDPIFENEICIWEDLICHQWDKLPHRPYVYTGIYSCYWVDEGELSRVCDVKAYGTEIDKNVSEFCTYMIYLTPY